MITVMLDAMGIGLIMPVMPDLIREVRGASLAQAAVWGGILSTAFAVMQFLCGPMLGALSDRYGRRRVLLVSLAVMALDYVVMSVAGSIWLLLAARIVGGITAATHATAAAYMADISKPEDKAANFGLVGAGVGIGFVLGPLVGGLLGEFGTRAPFIAAAALAALNLTFGYFVLRETVTDRIRRDFTWSRTNPLGAIRQVAHLPGLRGLLTIYLLYSIAYYVYPAVWSYFALSRFDWNPGMIGLSLALYGVSTAVMQGFLTRPILNWLGDRATVIYSHLFDMLTFLILAFLTNGFLALCLIPISALGSVMTPALQGIMSRAASDDQQGELQGVLASLHAISMILSPLMMTTVFAFFTSSGTPLYLPGAPFLVSLLLMGISLLIFIRARSAVT